MKKSTVVLIVITIVAALIGYSVLGPLLYEYTISTQGVHVEYGLISNPSTIDWGASGLNEQVSRSLTLTNTGSKDFLNLTAYYGNESVNLVNYTLAWDGEGLSLAIGASLLVNFTFIKYEFDNATGNTFTFDIYISDKG